MPTTARASTIKTADRRGSPDTNRSRATRDTTVAFDSAADALEALGDIELGMRTLEVKRVRLIGAAQQLGATWEDIGSALGTSRQAAWETYRDQARQLLEVTAGRARQSEDVILESAGQVLKEVRARRRRR